MSLLKEFSRIGRDLFLSGLVSSHGGNISIRAGDKIIITRRGSMLAHLNKEDLIETGLYKDDSGIIMASTEIIVHRAIYFNTSALAIVHSHPPAAIALSLFMDEIIPIDSEASYLLHKIPVIATKETIGSKDVANIIPDYLQEYKIVMLRGHGAFSIGDILEEAYMLHSTLENACRIIAYGKIFGNAFKEYRKDGNKYTKW
ncbi:MAG: fuculose phosphate aldolase [Deltaproteobacteria bacterium]|nr:MAG: fuculose phosphate aldolase [Deltaproteobacteria bacterium]